MSAIFPPLDFTLADIEIVSFNRAVMLPQGQGLDCTCEAVSRDSSSIEYSCEYEVDTTAVNSTSGIFGKFSLKLPYVDHRRSAFAFGFFRYFSFGCNFYRSSSTKIHSPSPASSSVASSNTFNQLFTAVGIFGRPFLYCLLTLKSFAWMQVWPKSRIQFKYLSLLELRSDCFYLNLPWMSGRRVQPKSPSACFKS